MEETLVFIDGGFLSKLSKHFGNGKYIGFDLISFAKLLGKKEGLSVKKALYYTAPPFQSNPPTEDQIKRKKGYDKFISNFKDNDFFIIKEGRCQRLVDGKEDFSQKGVDALMTSGLISTSIKFPSVKKIILVTSDTDFCPILKDLEEIGIKVVLYTYYEKKRGSKFSVSHHLIDSCKTVRYLKKEDFTSCPLNAVNKIE
jgi:uncharacterized LabA/DUF88 family protein